MILKLNKSMILKVNLMYNIFQSFVFRPQAVLISSRLKEPLVVRNRFFFSIQTRYQHNRTQDQHKNIITKTVNRSFSNFQNLQQSLRSLLPGILVPSLPQKDLSFSKAFLMAKSPDKKSIQQREVWFEKFIQRIYSNQHLKGHSDCIRFFLQEEFTQIKVNIQRTVLRENNILMDDHLSHLKTIKGLAQNYKNVVCQLKLIDSHFEKHILVLLFKPEQLQKQIQKLQRSILLIQILQKDYSQLLQQFYRTTNAELFLRNFKDREKLEFAFLLANLNSIAESVEGNLNKQFFMSK